MISHSIIRSFGTGRNTPSLIHETIRCVLTIKHRPRDFFLTFRLVPLMQLIHEYTDASSSSLENSQVSPMLTFTVPTNVFMSSSDRKKAPWQIKARDGEREGVPASALPPTLSLDASSFRRQLGMCQTWSCYLAFLLPKIMKSSPSAKPSPSLSGSISSRCGLHTHRIRKKYCGEELSILSFSLTFYSFFFHSQIFFSSFLFTLGWAQVCLLSLPRSLIPTFFRFPP